MKIHIYGDSLMKGVLVDEHYKYKATAKALLERLEEETGIVAVNRAHFGCTSSKGQTILARDLDRGLDCQAALLEFGGNDCDFDWPAVAAQPQAEHQPHTPLAQFIDTLSSMARSLKEVGVQPILLSLPPLDAQRYLSFIGHLGSNTKEILRFLGDVQMIYRYQEMYSSAVCQLAARLGLPLIDIRSRFLSRRDYTGLVARDGIHLTQPGYELLYGEVRTQLAAL